MTPVSLQDSVIVFAGGGMLGLLFFSGLLLTVEKLIHYRWREIALVVSFALRAALVMVGFYFLAEGQFLRAIIALAGFILARVAIMALVKGRQGRAGVEQAEITDETH